jgi:hypothetical protein
MGERCRRCVRGIELPMGHLQAEALERLNCTAVIVCAGETYVA